LDAAGTKKGKKAPVVTSKVAVFRAQQRQEWCCGYFEVPPSMMLVATEDISERGVHLEHCKGIVTKMCLTMSIPHGFVLVAFVKDEQTAKLLRAALRKLDPLLRLTDAIFLEFDVAGGKLYIIAGNHRYTAITMYNLIQGKQPVLGVSRCEILVVVDNVANRQMLWVMSHEDNLLAGDHHKTPLDRRLLNYARVVRSHIAQVDKADGNPVTSIRQQIMDAMGGGGGSNNSLSLEMAVAKRCVHPSLWEHIMDIFTKGVRKGVAAKKNIPKSVQILTACQTMSNEDLLTPVREVAMGIITSKEFGQKILNLKATKRVLKATIDAYNKDPYIMTHLKCPISTPRELCAALPAVNAQWICGWMGQLLATKVTDGVPVALAAAIQVQLNKAKLGAKAQAKQQLAVVSWRVRRGAMCFVVANPCCCFVHRKTQSRGTFK
jgi:hypothetical protein